ncbi:helix-turn-helix domain-containing protein [Saccharopolyspora sp. NPDC050642]|uniref:TetR/AcrR family transcriptional regulator n=1 Tax=Saccharopolyspora sp. NPDC050642 TaxID=3157099 RepID=UPI0033C42330
MSPAGKPRADAERNRAQVLTVARDLLAERGEQVQMAEVARAAGVGVGTVYRHFPTRQALVEAVAEERFAAILAFGEAQCLPDPDTRQALTAFLHRIGEVHENERGLSGAIESVLGSTAPQGEVSTRLLAFGETLVERGKADGTLAAEATVADLYMIVGALATVSRAAIGDWRRFVDIALAGLRPRD